MFYYLLRLFLPHLHFDTVTNVSFCLKWGHLCRQKFNTIQMQTTRKLPYAWISSITSIHQFFLGRKLFDKIVLVHVHIETLSTNKGTKRTNRVSFMDCPFVFLLWVAPVKFVSQMTFEIPSRARGTSTVVFPKLNGMPVLQCYFLCQRQSMHNSQHDLALFKKIFI